MLIKVRKKTNKIEYKIDETNTINYGVIILKYIFMIYESRFHLKTQMIIKD